MKTALLRRLMRLEEVRAIENAPVELQFGYLKKLPAEYNGERQVVTVGREPDGKYRWVERPGPEPAGEDESNARRIVRLNLVRVPSEEWAGSAGNGAEQP